MFATNIRGLKEKVRKQFQKLPDTTNVVTFFDEGVKIANFVEEAASAAGQVASLAIDTVPAIRAIVQLMEGSYASLTDQNKILYADNLEKLSRIGRALALANEQLAVLGLCIDDTILQHDLRELYDKMTNQRTINEIKTIFNNRAFLSEVTQLVSNLSISMNVINTEVQLMILGLTKTPTANLSSFLKKQHQFCKNVVQVVGTQAVQPYIGPRVQSAGPRMIRSATGLRSARGATGLRSTRQPRVVSNLQQVNFSQFVGPNGGNLNLGGNHRSNHSRSGKHRQVKRKAAVAQRKRSPKKFRSK